MSYFAKIQPTGLANKYLVTEVISADQEFISSGVVGSPADWVQTSYNTHGNVHYAPSPPAEPGTPDGGIALRGNYAGIGYTYDVPNDVFYAPQPYPSWTLDENAQWQPPVPYPTDGVMYAWDEETTDWKAITNG